MKSFYHTNDLTILKIKCTFNLLVFGYSNTRLRYMYIILIDTPCSYCRIKYKFNVTLYLENTSVSGPVATVIQSYSFVFAKYNILTFSVKIHVILGTNLFYGLVVLPLNLRDQCSFISMGVKGFYQGDFDK